MLELLEKTHSEHHHCLLDQKWKLKTIPTWTDSDKPADLHRCFEHIMSFNEEPKEHWARLLSIHLMGKASSVFIQAYPSTL